MWKNIIVETSAPFRLALASAEVKYNAQEENDNRLFVVFADFLAERYINNADRKRELESIIADKTGKQVEVRFMLAADEGAQDVYKRQPFDPNIVIYRKLHPVKQKRSARTQ